MRSCCSSPATSPVILSREGCAWSRTSGRGEVTRACPAAAGRLGSTRLGCWTSSAPVAVTRSGATALSSASDDALLLREQPHAPGGVARHVVAGGAARLARESLLERVLVVEVELGHGVVREVGVVL